MLLLVDILVYGVRPWLKYGSDFIGLPVKRMLRIGVVLATNALLRKALLEKENLLYKSSIRGLRLKRFKWIFLVFFPVLQKETGIW